jgi:hypothetical protein
MHDQRTGTRNHDDDRSERVRQRRTTSRAQIERSVRLALAIGERALLSERLVSGLLLIRDQLVKTVDCLGPTLLMERAAPLGGKGSLVHRELSRAAPIPKRDRDDRLAIFRVGILPSKREGQTRRCVNLAELPDEKETIPLRRLHLDPISASDTQVELDARSRKPFGAPPLRQLVRLNAHTEHQWPRRGENTLKMQDQLVGPPRRVWAGHA